MTDRELLERAAKAAGISYYGTGKFRIISERGVQVGDHGDDSPRYWNPLTDDGDALRLAVKLKLWLNFTMDGTLCEVSDVADTVCAVEILGEDQLAATRRAIVRAAAAIGEQA